MDGLQQAINRARWVRDIPPVQQFVSVPAKVQKFALPKRTRPIEVTDAEAVFFTLPQPKLPTLRNIIGLICETYNVSRPVLFSSLRSVEIVMPRQIAYYLSRKCAMRSLNEIARAFGGRDHTTVLSGYRKIERLRQIDPELDAQLRALEARLIPRPPVPSTQDNERLCNGETTAGVAG